MNNHNTYKDLIEQTFVFPRLGFSTINNELYYHDIRLMDLVERFGTPFKMTYLPKISEQIIRAKDFFQESIQRNHYKGGYKYCYCTKSSHFRFVMDEVFKNDVHVETSSEFDFGIVDYLLKNNKINKDTYVVSNGYKTKKYLERIVEHQEKLPNTICVLDNMDELDQLASLTNKPLKLGIRFSTVEHPSFTLYNSRLGVKASEVMAFYKNKISPSKQFELKLVHFFINKGISDTSYYWSELKKYAQLYCELKKVAPELSIIDIGGGLKIHEGLGEEMHYSQLIDEIVKTIGAVCDEYGVEHPAIFTEFGSHTVGESGATIYSVLGQKEQNEIERWYMIDSSFITTLPDTWGIGQKFILLALNNWDHEYRRIQLGGITCDGLDYYNSEKQQNQVFMPEIAEGEQLCIGFFHTGAYQESLGGYGGIQHCLIPAPKHIIIDKKNGEHTFEVFAQEQTQESMMKILGYN